MAVEAAAAHAQLVVAAHGHRRRRGQRRGASARSRRRSRAGRAAGSCATQASGWVPEVSTRVVHTAKPSGFWRRRAGALGRARSCRRRASRTRRSARRRARPRRQPGRLGGQEAAAEADQQGGPGDRDRSVESKRHDIVSPELGRCGQSRGGASITARHPSEDDRLFHQATDQRAQDVGVVVGPRRASRSGRWRSSGRRRATRRSDASSRAITITADAATAGGGPMSGVGTNTCWAATSPAAARHGRGGGQQVQVAVGQVQDQHPVGRQLGRGSRASPPPSAGGSARCRTRRRRSAGGRTPPAGSRASVSRASPST